MERNDIELALDLYYEEMGWEKNTGAPTAAAYRRVGMQEVAEELEKRGLLP